MSGHVFDLKIHAGNLYVAGGFSSIGGSDGTGGGVPRKNLAAMDLAAGVTVTSWNPTAAQIGEVRSLAFHGASVFAVGTFIGPNPGPIEGIRTNADHVVRLDLATGAAVGPARPFNNGTIIWAVASQGEHIFLGGGFNSVAGVQHDHLAELTGRDGSLRPWNPQPNEIVTALTLANGQLLVGGGFRSLGGMPRERLAAYDLATMQLSAWNPQITAIFGGFPINELLPRDGVVFVAGNFQAVGGQPRTNLAKVDLTTGLPLNFRADADGSVMALAIAGGHLYVGGDFSRLGGVARSDLARVDLDSGVVDDWAPEPDSWGVTDLSANSTALYVSGRFLNIAGATRYGSAAFSLQTGGLLPWSLDAYVWQPSPYVASLFATDNLVYAVGGFSPGPDDYRGLLVVDPTTTALGSWDTRPYFYLSPKRLLLEGGRLFLVGEHFSSVGSTSTLTL